MGFLSMGSGRRGGPVASTLGKWQAAKAAGVNWAARIKLGDIGGGLRWSSGDKKGMRGLPTFPSWSLTDAIA
jgi:hypothetical protein